MKKNNIIIFGYGSFGQYLHKSLFDASYNVKVVSFDDGFIDKAHESDVEVIKMDIRKDSDILSLNINEYSDLLYCAMPKTADNLFLVLTLRALYKDAVIIAISNSHENTRKLKYAGASNIVDLYEATSRRVVNILTKPAVTKALDEIVYKQNRLKMAEIKIPKNSFIDGRSIDDIDFKGMGIVLIAIIDEELGHKFSFTDHRINHKLDENDTLVVVAMRDDLEIFKNKLKNL